MFSFFKAERESAGWRFLIVWIGASLAGFVPGIALEMLYLGGVSLWIAVPLALFGQGWVLNRHLSLYLPWTIGSTLIWWLVLGVSSSTMSMLPMDNIALWIRTGTNAALAGAAMGLLQWWLLREWLPNIGIWWVAVSALSWASFLPGVITGFVLMWALNYVVVPMEERRYELSGDF